MGGYKDRLAQAAELLDIPADVLADGLGRAHVDLDAAMARTLRAQLADTPETSTLAELPDAPERSGRVAIPYAAARALADHLLTNAAALDVEHWPAARSFIVAVIPARYPRRFMTGAQRGDRIAAPLGNLSRVFGDLGYMEDTFPDVDGGQVYQGRLR